MLLISIHKGNSTNRLFKIPIAQSVVLASKLEFMFFSVEE